MVQARTITDFSVAVGSVIDIDELVDYQALTSGVYGGTFDPSNTFSLNADIDFSGETKTPINAFKGTFNGNGFRLSNHDSTYVFDTLGADVIVDNVVFHNFYAPSLLGITASLTGSASVTNCVCCGTFVTAGAAFCDFMDTTVTFANNSVLLSGSSRIIGTRGAGIVSRDAQAMTRCFFAGTSDVFLRGTLPTGLLCGISPLSGENACNFNGYLQSTQEAGGLCGTVSSTPNGCAGLYACGSFDTYSPSTSDFVGRLVGNKTGGTITESYYYGSGDITCNTTRVNQVGQGVNSATIFAERRPSIQGSNYLKTDVVAGAGLKGSDTSVWAGGDFAGPDILRNVPHTVPVEDFAEIHDPIGTLQVHLANKTDYPVFVKFTFDDPSVSFVVLDTEHRQVTGYEARIVSRHHTLTNGTETVTNASGLEYYVNATAAEFEGLSEPSTVVGTPAKDITDFSIHVGDVIIGDFADLNAMHKQNYAGTFHAANRFFQVADVQYPEASTIVGDSYIDTFEGVFDGSGFRIIDTHVAGTSPPIHLSQRSTIKNLCVNNFTSPSALGYFVGHTTGSIVRHCNVVGDLTLVGPAFCQTTTESGIFEDCQVLASGQSIQSNFGAAFDNTSSVKRIFVATQPGHGMTSFDDIGGVMKFANSNVSKIGCNLRSFIHTTLKIGLIMGISDNDIPGQPASKGYYACGNTLMLGTGSASTTKGLVGFGNINEYFSANSGDVIMQTAGLTSPVPNGKGTLFAEFTGKIFDQAFTNNPVVGADVSGREGAMYTYDATVWTAPWDLSSHLDYPSMLIDVPHFVPVPSDEAVRDPMCTIQMYASSRQGYSVFFKIQGDRYETDYYVDLIGKDGVQTPTDGTWVLQFTFPFDVEATKNVIFRGTTLSSDDARTYVIGGIPFTPIADTTPTIACKDVTDFSVFYPGIITMNDVTDFQTVIPVRDFHPSNEFHMTADVDIGTITDTIIFFDFQGTFDGKGYRIMNSSAFTFLQHNSPLGLCTIQNVIFQNTFASAPVLRMYGRGKMLNCVSAGRFSDVTCGLVQQLNNFSSIEGCYVLASGDSVMNAGLSDGVSRSFLGVSKSFFCASSSVLIQNANADTGCISNSCSLGGGVGVNFLGDMRPTSATQDSDLGGLSGNSWYSNGLGYYVSGDFTIQKGNGLIDRIGQSGVGFDEVYYANKGAITGTVDIRQGFTGASNVFGATAFAEFSGTYNGQQLTEDVSNIKSGSAGVYSRAPEIWWSPWDFVTTRPSFLKETPHFVPVESSAQFSDILGSVTIELEDLTQYPIFVRVEYVNETDMSVTFFSKNYAALTTGIAVEIVFPLAVTRDVYHNSSVVSSDDNLRYTFGAPLGTLVPGYGPTAINAADITDFSVFIDAPIILNTPADVQAMYKGNYTGTFDANNSFFMTSDIDLNQETFDAANDVIVNFTGGFNGNGYKLWGHVGNFLATTTGAKVDSVVFMDFTGPALIGDRHDATNCVFMSGAMTGNQTSVLGSSNINGSGITQRNNKVFVYGTPNFTTGAVLSAANGASDIFLATSSTVTYSGNCCVARNGKLGSNIACNVNGQLSSNEATGILLSNVTVDMSDSGGMYVSGDLSIDRINTNTRPLSHLIGWHDFTNRSGPLAGGCFTTVTGVMSKQGVARTDYISDRTQYATAFKDFVAGLTEDLEGQSGGVYDLDTSFWAAPWLLSDHLDHPSMLKAIPHYLVVENDKTTNDILGGVRVVSSSYPVFLEIAYSKIGPIERFTYRVLNTSYTEDTDAVAIITYPFDVQDTTQIWARGEEVTSLDKRFYTVGSPFFASKISPISVELSWVPVAVGLSYRLTARVVGTSFEQVVVRSTERTTAFARNLEPDTQYVFCLYSISGNARTLQYCTSVTTLESNASNYGELATSIEDPTTGVFDLTQLSRGDRERFSDFIEDVFPVGTKLKVEIPGRRVNSTVVHRGGSVAVAEAEAVVTSFNNTDAGQFIEITAEDATALRLEYDETANAFQVGDETYEIEESFVFDGEKVAIFEI